MYSSRFRFLLYGILVVQCLAFAVSGAREIKIQARIEFDSWDEYEQFMTYPDLDVIEIRPGIAVRFVSDARQLTSLQSLGFPIEVEITDMQEYYARGITGDNFGSYHTYSETGEFLDALHESFPHITTEKVSIGLTHEGRDIWAMKISDNPWIDEGEPEILLDGLHHAREIMAIEVILYYMKWLCDGYGVEEEPTFLVDNREIWCIPVVNPDGLVYNEMTDPEGGGMWRKNRRDNGDGTYGVDLNRNYPYEWGCENSSDETSSETYRGPSPGTEPEVNAMMNFMMGHSFVSHISFHSFCQFVYVPWDYTTELAPDHELLMWWGDRLAYYNGYIVSAHTQGSNNALCGTTMDYAYGEQVEKNKIFSSVIEIGMAFWPEENKILQINQDILWPQIFNTRTAGVYLDPLKVVPVGGDNDGLPDAGEDLDLQITLENQSLFENADNVQVIFLTDDPYVQINDATSTYGTVCPGAVGINLFDAVSLHIDSAAPDGHPIEYTLRILADGFSYDKKLSWLVGNPDTLFVDDFEDGFSNWTVYSGTWGLTTDESHSPATSVTDSPDGLYAPVHESWIELASPLNTTIRRSADLLFWHRYETEEGDDFCYVDVSRDSGRTWWPMRERYHGLLTEWRPERISLYGFTGTDSLSVRFRLRTRWGENAEGWFIDDVMIVGSKADNIPPSQPSILSPVHGTTVPTRTPRLTVSNADDPDGPDLLSYGFLVYGDPYFTDLAAYVSGIDGGPDSTSWIVDVDLEETTYWWRAYADDGVERGLLMPAGSFTVEELHADSENPSKIILNHPEPNPFTIQTTIRFELPFACRAELSVYDLNGRVVRSLFDDEVDRGETVVRWDGRDDTGRIMANGSYIIQLKVGDLVRKRVAVILR